MPPQPTSAPSKNPKQLSPEQKAPSPSGAAVSSSSF
ncbi:hypothetical protein Vi05172_g12692 [Venturia inaequalis]|nr:hypothetical protein Vi05172_g12692 [Venturia inaequalis]